MNPRTLGLRVAGTIFGLMSVAQLLRILIWPEILIEGYLFPLWPSFLAFPALACLSAWLWKLSAHD
jgi:hypothetical protein